MRVRPFAAFRAFRVAASRSGTIALMAALKASSSEVWAGGCFGVAFLGGELLDGWCDDFRPDAKHDGIRFDVEGDGGRVTGDSVFVYGLSRLDFGTGSGGVGSVDSTVSSHGFDLPVVVCWLPVEGDRNACCAAAIISQHLRLDSRLWRDCTSRGKPPYTASNKQLSDQTCSMTWNQLRDVSILWISVLSLLRPASPWSGCLLKLESCRQI